MGKVKVSEPMIIAQSTKEPILFGGYQDPFIRCNDKKELFLRYNTRRDCLETFGKEHTNPIFKSTDEGKTWEFLEEPLFDWITAQKPLPNGDYLQIGEHEVIKDFGELPELPEYRKKCSGIACTRDVYLVDELLPILGDKIEKEFKAYRVKAGTNEVVEETCKVNWPNMPVSLYEGAILCRVFPAVGYNYAIDKQGVLWLPVPAPYVTSDGKLGSQRSCTHMLKSDDMGHTWDYVSTIVYKEEYNNPNCIDIEGFNECAVDVLEDGTIYCILRSGSLHPFIKGDDEHPAPKLYCAKSKDEGKTWEEISPFYDYGVLPQMIKLNCGTHLMSSGRPGVYIRSCSEPDLKEWNDIIPIVAVPDEEVYGAYYEYSCSNTALCAYDEHTAFLTYSDFTLKTPNGERAKSILIRKITVE